MLLRLCFIVCFSSLFLIGCSGDDDDSVDNTIPADVTVNVIGLRPVAEGQSQLSLIFPDGTATTVTEDRVINYDNTESRQRTQNISAISTHPEGQACVVRFDRDLVSSESAIINVICGYRNEIRVTGIEGFLGNNNPLQLTRDIFFFENQNTAINYIAIQSIFQNSTEFSPTPSGEPVEQTYYSFLYGVSSAEIPNYEQDLRILRNPDGYKCLSFEGEQGFYQVACNKTDNQPQNFTPRHDLAQKCVAIKASDSAGYIIQNATNDGYILSGVDDVSTAETFFLKPTRLGGFLLFDSGSGYLTEAASGQVVRTTTVSDNAEWALSDRPIIDFVDGAPVIVQRQTILPYDDRRILNHDLVLGLPFDQEDDPHQDESYEVLPESFIFEETTGCTDFPEASLNANVSAGFYSEKDVTQPVSGYADVHAHIGAPRSMGAMAMAGDVMHRFGVEHALADCDRLHGDDGGNDLIGTQIGTALGATHSITGYPDFNTDWPSSGAVSHIQAYYKWIERAYLSGLRLTVTMATGSEVLCDVLTQVIRKKAHGCDPKSSVEAQTDYIYEIQDYIDSQEGGPGEGWFRVVKTSQEAREVIADNKLAVIIGVEHSTLFGCRRDGDCDEAKIRNDVNALYEAGVRTVVPIYRVDNAFGGTQPGAGSDGAWFNLMNKVSTGTLNNIVDVAIDAVASFFSDLPDNIGGEYYAVKACDTGIAGQTDIYSMREFRDNELENLIESAIDDPMNPETSAENIATALNAIDARFDDPYPEYAAFQAPSGSAACNEKGLNVQGEILIDELINQGMFIDLSNMSYDALDSTLSILEGVQYPAVVASHGFSTSSTVDSEIVNRVFNLGGIAAIEGQTPTAFDSQITSYVSDIVSNPGTNFSKSFPLSSNIQGLIEQPGADVSRTIDYPFDSSDGFVEFEMPKTGEREFDYNAEGVSHYGLYAEWVRHLGLLNSASLENLMNSAEAYIQMWERAETFVEANAVVVE